MQDQGPIGSPSGPGGPEGVEARPQETSGQGGARRVRVPITVTRSPAPQPWGEGEGVYVISVASRLLEMHPQTLRKYERLGLVQPSRTQGRLRLYSDEDLARLRLIKHLEEELGVNLAGVEMALNLLTRLMEMRRRLLGTMQGGLRGLIEEEMEEIFRLLRFPPPEESS
ncbi:MAG: helix-turn-helix transcriptional regulator [Chloroflexi bacterium]|nr:helix-turn-helix transcriptional regulator [Chloroflexota bacterium]